MEDRTEQLQRFDDSKLIDIVKNYRQYGYDDTIRNTAIDILKSRGIEEEHLKLTGNFQNQQYDRALELSHLYALNSKRAFAFYGLRLVLAILSNLVSVNSAFLESVLLIAIILSLLLFFIFFIKSFSNINGFYQTIDKKLEIGNQLVFFVIGMPLYLFMYFFYKTKMKEEVSLIR